MKYKTSSTLPKTLLWCTRLHDIYIDGLVCALDWWSDLFFKFMEQSAHQISGVQCIRLHELLIQWSSLLVRLVGQFRRWIRGVVCMLNSWSSLCIRLLECFGSGCIGVRLLEQFAFQISGSCGALNAWSSLRIRLVECGGSGCMGLRLVEKFVRQSSGVVCAGNSWSSLRIRLVECCGSCCMGLRLVEQFALQISSDVAHRIRGVFRALDQWNVVNQVVRVIRLVEYGRSGCVSDWISGVVWALKQWSDVAH